MNSPSEIGKRMTPKRLYPYTSTKTDVWNIITQADSDPFDTGKINLLYTRYSIPPGEQGEEYLNGWNREHIFCQSFLHSSAGKPSIATDCHNLFATDSSINSTRSNKMYDIGGTCVIDRSPAAGYEDSRGECNLEALHDRDSFEPPDISKGVCARAMFYMACVYADYGLVLGEESIQSQKQMGKLSVLLKWNKSFPPSTWEISRNNIIEKYQGNRNVFIDDHLLIEKVSWVQDVRIAKHLVDKEISTDTMMNYFAPFLNEIHYDNEGCDEHEGVEVCTHVSENLGDLWVLFYNGKDGLIYRKCNLADFEAGVLYTENEVRMMYFKCNGIQNGGAKGDGIALTRKGTVVEFLSYENAFTAKEGPCECMVSEKIGVSETNKTRTKSSLQRVGTGRNKEDFQWCVSGEQSFGALNKGQVFTKQSRE